MTVDGDRGRWPSLRMSSRRSRALPQREGPAPRVALAVVLPNLPRTSSSRAGAASRLCLWPHWGHGSRTRASSFLRFAFFSGEGAASCDRQAGSRSRSRGGASSTCFSPSGCRWTWLCGVLCRQARPPVDIDYCDPIVSTPFTATQEGRVVTLSAWMGDEPLVRLPCSRGAPPAGRRRHRVPPPILWAAQRGRGAERPARGVPDSRLFLLRRTPTRTPLGAGCGTPRRRCCTPWSPCPRAATSPPSSSSTPPLCAEATALCRGRIPAWSSPAYVARLCSGRSRWSLPLPAFVYRVW